MESAGETIPAMEEPVKPSMTNFKIPKKTKSDDSSMEPVSLLSTPKKTKSDDSSMEPVSLLSTPLGGVVQKRKSAENRTADYLSNSPTSAPLPKKRRLPSNDQSSLATKPLLKKRCLSNKNQEKSQQQDTAIDSTNFLTPLPLPKKRCVSNKDHKRLPENIDSALPNDASRKNSASSHSTKERSDSSRQKKSKTTDQAKVKPIEENGNYTFVYYLKKFD